MLRAVDWDRIDLLVFDLDGTLYDQTRLRAHMAAALAAATLRSGDLRLLLMLHHFRKVREALGASPEVDFVQRQYEITAERCGTTADAVKAVVREWMEERPLGYLGACRAAGIETLFAAVRRANKKVAVLSDYPAPRKLAALGLAADITVSADEPDVGRLKPDPAGLSKVLFLARASVSRAIMIGDRVDRDHETARRLGMRALIRTQRPVEGVETFRTYRDPLFQPLLRFRGSGGTSA